ncbi:hypothetical protein VaNZ11_007273 [Volvox africanus]|uniref:RING-type domain-containing protein n=1 Tax=Volvox africanus TaxID=51714 RepID=A0ABQ5S3F3_9CHLO|nr:hypothetical protein VaNZ11_007273 [Volvox africanus]
MLIFFFSSGQGGSWSLGPLILALLPLLFQLGPYLLQETLGTQGLYKQPFSFLDALWLVIGLVLCAMGITYAVKWIRRNGGWRFLLQLILQGYHAGPDARFGGGAGFQEATGSTGRHGQPQSRVTLEQITEALMELPTEPYMTAEQLAALPVHDLKELIHGRNLEPVKCLEKQDLVNQLLEHGGSSAHSCGICCEEYAAAPGVGGPGWNVEEPQQVLRVLRCGHRFHVECVDRWFMSSTEYSRQPACPLCNTPLLRPKGR